MEEMVPDSGELSRLLSYRMPFGKFKGRLLLDLPEPYVVWWAQRGFPEGSLGEMLRCLYDIKANGLERMLRPLLNGADGEREDRARPGGLIEPDAELPLEW